MGAFTTIGPDWDLLALHRTLTHVTNSSGTHMSRQRVAGVRDQRGGDFSLTREKLTPVPRMEQG